MKRQVFEVYAKVIDGSGAYNTLSGYPKAFDSHAFNDNIDRALMRATAEFANTWGAMCLREDRQLQMVMLMTADGFVIDKKVIGQIADLPDAEPEVEE